MLEADTRFLSSQDQMRLNLTTTHDILVSFVQAPSECPKAKKARADRDFHSPLIPPLNVSPELDPQNEAQLDLTTEGRCGCRRTLSRCASGWSSSRWSRCALTHSPEWRVPCLLQCSHDPVRPASGGPRGGGHIDREAALAGGRSVQKHRWLTRASKQC